MRNTTIAGLVLASFAVAFCLQAPARTADSVSIAADHTLVSWQSVQAGTAWNISQITVELQITTVQNPQDTLELWAYFQDQTAALAPVNCPGCGALPSMNFMIEPNSTSWMAVSNTGPYGAPGGSVLLFQQTKINGSTVIFVSQSFNLNLTNVQSIAAATYYGTLFFRARVTGPPHGTVQAESNAVAIQLTVAAQASLTVSVNSAAVYWDTSHGNPLVPGNSNNYAIPALTLTVGWQVPGSVTSIPVYAFFTDPQTALTAVHGTATVPASSFLMQVNAGAYQPVLPSNGQIGYKCAEIQVNSGNLSGTQSYQLQFNINLGGGQLSADNYVGTLYLQAEAVQ